MFKMIYIKLTDDSWGKRVTKAIKSSQPAFMLIEFVKRFRNSSAPSFKACTSSNIVPAGGVMNNVKNYTLKYVTMVTNILFDCSISSVSASIAASGFEIYFSNA